MAEATETEDKPATKAKAKTCPSCGAEMVQHPEDSPNKAGAWHCNGCGKCWNADLKSERL